MSSLRYAGWYSVLKLGEHLKKTLFILFSMTTDKLTQSSVFVQLDVDQ
jgi:hypothetical protein